MNKIANKPVVKKTSTKQSSTKKTANKSRKQKTKSPGPSKKQTDGEVRDNLLLDKEAIGVDTDEISGRIPPAKTDEALAPETDKTARSKNEKLKIKPKGADAEAKILKKNQKKKYPLPPDWDIKQKELKKLKTQPYLDLITPLHVELLKFQNWAREEKLRVVALFEGRDAAGKGGTVKRFIEHMNPRGFRVVALDKPTDEERNQWYFQRYVRHLPTAGEIVLFDRSWYNRAMVERVMSFCTGDEVKEFLRSVPEFERMLIRSGIILFKFYFSVSKKEQARRFHNRINDPLKQWKLSPVDREGQGKWDEYTLAKEDTFFYTSTSDCPWTIIKSDDKKRARLNAIRFFLRQFDYPNQRKDLLEVDPRITRTVQEEMGVED